ncbi:MAG: CBS domain-containing protein [Pseudomonadota bacterium]
MQIQDRPEFASKPKPMTALADDTIRTAAERMAQKNYGAVIIVDDAEKVIGMLTERDLMRRVLAESRDPDTTKVADVMTREVRVARKDDNLIDWLRIMSNERFRRLPIVDERGKLTSIMTQGDFVSYTWPDLINQAVTLAKGTMGKNYQIFYILAGVLFYTLAIGLAFAYIARG